MIICPKCNKQLEDGSLFCDACGEKIVAQQAPAVESAPAAAAKPALDVKKIAILGGAAVAVVLVLVLLGSLIFGGGKPDYALYIKDGELQYSNFDKVIEVTDNLYGEAGNQQLSGMGTRLGYYSLLTDDGNKLFYIDKISNGEYTLYCRDIKNPKNEPIKIDTNISGYMVNQKGDLVTYIKNDGEAILYQHNLKDKTKIKGEIDDFVASLDGKNILYKNVEGNLYLKKGNKDEEKIASEIEDILYVNKDISKIYYTKEGSLYLKDGSKDAAKIVSDVASVYKIYDNGKFYYVESKEEEETNEGGDGPVVDERAITADDAAGSAIDSFIEESTSVLYFYNGKEKVKLTDAYFGSCVYSVEKQVLAYSVLNADEIDEETMDVSKAVEWYIAVEGNATKISVENITTVRIARDGKTAYVMSVEPVKDTASEGEGENAEVKEPTGEIYKIKISSKAESPEKLDSDVYAGTMMLTRHGNVMYFKEVKNGEGELYIDKTKIDDEVKVDSVQYLKDAKKVVYYSDYNSEKGHGTLEIATLKGKTTKIADDVKTFVVNPKEDILYINDYSATTYKGTLYRFSGNKSKKVDEDVVAIVGYTSFTEMIARQYGWID